MQFIVEVCLRMAVRRWPESMRAERMREWKAELHQLGHRQRLRFAWSLAWSPRVTEDGTTVGWRETLPSLARGALPIVVLPLVGAGCGAASGLVPHLLGYQTLYGHPYWVRQTVAAASVAAAAIPAFWLGRWIGHRAPLAWAHGGWRRRAGSAMMAPVLVGAGIVSMHTTQLRMSSPYDPDIVGAVYFWAATCTVLAGVVVWLSGRFGRLRAGLVAAGGTLAVLELAAVIAAQPSALQLGHSSGRRWWFLEGLLTMRGSDLWLGITRTYIDPGFAPFLVIYENAGAATRPLVVASLFVFGYGLAAADRVASLDRPRTTVVAAAAAK